MFKLSAVTNHLYGKTNDVPRPTCSTPCVMRGVGVMGVYQIRPGRGESGKHRWPLQMSCDLRPWRGGSPVRPCGMYCQRRAGGENLRRLMGVCVCVCGCISL